MKPLLPRTLTLSAIATAMGTAALLAGCASAPRTTPHRSSAPPHPPR